MGKRPEEEQQAADDAAFMRRALALARRGHGHVAPNPMVGAVLVRDGRVIGQGYHEKYGEAHAEVNAIADARRQGHDPRGATLHVTLEPCSHHGKTPPCALAVLEAGVTRVVCAMVDPFSQVSGRGIAMLRDQGVTVEVGLLEAEARELNRVFLKRVATGLPWVTLKWAQSIDGKIAAASGDSRWISSAASRRLVHQMRGRVDAVMVGVGTAAADDPQLTARDVPFRRRAVRVVVDPKLRLGLEAKLFATSSCDMKKNEGAAPRKGGDGGDGSGGGAGVRAGGGDGRGGDGREDGGVVDPPVVVMTSAAALKERGGHVRALMGLGVDVVALRAWQGGGRGDGAGGRVARGAAGDVLQDASGDVSQGAVSRVLDLRQGLVHLMQKHGVSEVLVEGGGVLHGQLLAQGLVDQMLVFVGGRVIGDERARSGVAGLDCATMAQAGHARLQGVKAVGGDVLMDWRVGGVA